jgi:hypothetical protein
MPRTSDDPLQKVIDDLDRKVIVIDHIGRVDIPKDKIVESK